MSMTCILTTLGAKFLAKLGRGDTDASPILYVGIGDGQTALGQYQTTLVNEIASRELATVTYASTYVRLTVAFTGLTEGDYYREFGVFDEPFGGIMYSRHSPNSGTPGEATTITARQVPSTGVVNAVIDYYVVQGSY